MKKIISLFQRNYEGNRKVINVVNKDAEWVIQGQGKATRKWDGTAVLIKDGVVFQRLDAGKGRKVPEGFVPAQPNPDPVSRSWPGWIPAVAPAAIYILQAFDRSKELHGELQDGTYEACGPRIGGKHGKNPESLTEHILVKHGDDVLVDVPLDYDGLMEYLRERTIEGIVWHHPDGRMVKIKKSDFPY